MGSKINYSYYFLFKGQIFLYQRLGQKQIVLFLFVLKELKNDNVFAKIYNC